MRLAGQFLVSGGRVVNEQLDGGLFRSAHEALLFAFNFAGRHDRPLIDKLASPSIGGGKGLAGMDGAAQAGMIRSELHAIGRLHESILIARVAPRTSHCDCRSPCCSGHLINREWLDAVGYLTEYANAALSGRFAHYRLRSAIIQKYFGVKISMVDIADDCGVARTTANDHNARVVKLLRVEEGKAWSSIDDRLQASGVVGQI